MEEALDVFELVYGLLWLYPLVPFPLSTLLILFGVWRWTQKKRGTKTGIGSVAVVGGSGVFWSATKSRDGYDPAVDSFHFLDVGFWIWDALPGVALSSMIWMTAIKRRRAGA